MSRHSWNRLYDNNWREFVADMSSMTPLGIPLPKDWDLKPLGHLCSKIGSGSTPQGGATGYLPSGVSLIRSQNVFDHRFSPRGLAFISESAAQKLAGATVLQDDVLLNITGDGETIARCCLVPITALPARVNQHVVILRAGQDLVPGFLQRYISQPLMREFMLSHNSGGSRRALTKGQIEAFMLPVPPFKEQQAIAQVLGALDEKIAVNTKLSVTASEFAMALVADHRPSVTLADVVVHQKRGLSPAEFGDARVAHFSLPAFDAGQQPQMTSPEEIKSSKFSIEQPCVLVSKLNPRFPRIWDVVKPPKALAVASTEFLVLESSCCTSTVLWAILSQPSFSAELETKVAGTSGSHQRVRPDDLLATEVIDPSLLSEQTKAALECLGRRIADSREESTTLVAMRDALLPALMSGKIRVKDAEQMVGDVV
jgi:type I restriction enzyme S subunit